MYNISGNLKVGPCTDIFISIKKFSVGGLGLPPAGYIKGIKQLKY
jgi:hypothetical protein